MSNNSSVVCGKPAATRRHALDPAGVLSPLSRLIEQWQLEEETLRSRYGMEHLAQLCQTHVRELKEAVLSQREEVLTLAQASVVSGYSTSHLRALIAESKLQNAGRKGAPRVRRGELPTRPAVAPESPAKKPVSDRGPSTKFDAERAASRALKRVR